MRSNFRDFVYFSYSRLPSSLSLRRWSISTNVTHTHTAPIAWRNIFSAGIYRRSPFFFFSTLGKYGPLARTHEIFFGHLICMHFMHIKAIYPSNNCAKLNDNSRTAVVKLLECEYCSVHLNSFERRRNKRRRKKNGCEFLMWLRRKL